MWFNEIMSAEPKLDNTEQKRDNTEIKNIKFYRDQSKTNSNKVNLNDLISRMKTEEKQVKKNNMLISCVAISAVAVFGVLLTL